MDTALRRKTDDGTLGHIGARNSHNTNNLGFILYIISLRYISISKNILFKYS